MTPATGVIPARYGSSRFPGKPLAAIRGKPMIQWVWERVRRARLIDRVLVATDDDRILRACAAFGAEAVLTSPGHASGTDRVAEAVRAAGVPGIVVNVQGDEPLVDPDLVDALVEAVRDPAVPIASAMRRETDPALLADPNRVKVRTGPDGFALDFSRAPLRSGPGDLFYIHQGIYAYRREALLAFCALPPSPREAAERLEQLRALEHGLRIRMVVTEAAGLSVDVPGDIIEVEKILGADGA